MKEMQIEIMEKENIGLANWLIKNQLLLHQRRA
jgi:hypothetical protein